MENDVGSVVGLWRYPVKSMMGEELNLVEIGERGVVGDRQFALRDADTGRIVGAKNPRKWGNLLDFRAAFIESPLAGSATPSVRITLPDGTVVASDQGDLEHVLSAALGREVTFEQVPRGGTNSGRTATAEEYWPDIAGLEYRDTVTEWDLPSGTFFDLATVHLLTTATLDRLRVLYPQGRWETRRFRSNLVVAASGDGFVENDWVGRRLAIGDAVQLRITGRCSRCVMVNLAQGDLPEDPGILQTIARHNGADAGVYASVERGGEARRGDAVRLLDDSRA